MGDKGLVMKGVPYPRHCEELQWISAWGDEAIS